MYFLFKMRSFHCYVCLPEGNPYIRRIWQSKFIPNCYPGTSQQPQDKKAYRWKAVLKSSRFIHSNEMTLFACKSAMETIRSHSIHVWYIYTYIFSTKKNNSPFMYVTIPCIHGLYRGNNSACFPWLRVVVWSMSACFSSPSDTFSGWDAWERLNHQMSCSVEKCLCCQYSITSMYDTFNYIMNGWFL